MFVFTHADLLALRVEYHAPTTWNHLTADSQRRETIHFRLTANLVQPASDFFHINIVGGAEPTTELIQNGGEGHVTGNGTKLIATAVTSGLAVTAVVMAVVGVVVMLIRGRRSRQEDSKRSRSFRLCPGKEESLVSEVQLPEVVLVAVSNLPPGDVRPPTAPVREPIAVDWSNVDPEILQHCRTTDPILHSEKVWV